MLMLDSMGVVLVKTVKCFLLQTFQSPVSVTPSASHTMTAVMT